jgi:phage terminase large subunit GpA-like protein
MTSIAELVGLGLEAFRPPEKLTLSEWADRNAFLSAESSAEGGRWRTLPYQKGIMDAITDPNIEQVTVMKSARVGYTKILNHLIAYHIHQDPCPIMLCQPTLDDCQSYSKDEIAPMLRDTPCLQGLVSNPRAKDGDNTLLKKNFPGGTLQLVGSNSARGFRMVSRRVVLFDETDGYPPSAGTEGDQIKLGIRRTEYYWNRKIVAGSTPTVEDFSRIERLFKDTNQQRYFVPCPECNHSQYLRWDNMKWVDNDPDTACYACESCGTLIPHSKKRWMVERGEWRPTAEGKAKHVGFHIWAAYSYSPNATWSNLVEEWLASKDNPEQLRTYINTVLGEVWQDEYEAKIGANALMERAASETYKQGIPPKEVLILFAGIDTQDDRLSLSVWGVGRHEEMFLIDRVKIYGAPSRMDVWNQLDEILSSPYTNEEGIELKIHIAAIDTGGHFTDEVYRYAKDRINMGVIPIKGVAKLKTDVFLGKPNKIETNSVGKSLKRSLFLFSVSVNKIKTHLHRRLKEAEPGKGFLHFYPTITNDYFDELTAEREVRKMKNGYQAERVWMKKSGARNEALDEMVYAYAALQRLYQIYDRRTVWNQLEARRDQILRDAGKNDLIDEKPVESVYRPPQRRVFKPKSTSFVSNW